MNPGSTILLVEDNADDELLTRRELHKSTAPARLVVARDGAQALDYLFARGEYADRDPEDLPALILLDLNLPKLSGLDVLQEIRADERTKLVPVVVLTSSGQDVDVLRGYECGANSYVVKPVEFGAFSQTVRHLGLYWTMVNHGPPL